MMRPMAGWVPPELEEFTPSEPYSPSPTYWGEGLVTPARDLTAEHLRHCVVFPHRLALLEHLPKRATVVEVGTLHGEFARTILAVADPRELHLIDHVVHDDARAFVNEPAARGRVSLHEGDSVEVLKRFADEYFDWIYIDAQHEYDGVKRDIEVARRKVKPDGLLVFNDYTVWSYVEMQPYGVAAAVNELCLEDGWEFVYLALPGHLYCDVAVRRRQRHPTG
jgi:predicted O-methyltransferase YrrM